MQVRELKISGAFEFTPSVFPDDRGLFVAPYQEAVFTAAVGHPLRVAQTNHSESRRGVVRGIHYADTPPGQAKYVHCPRGRMLDVVVDLRVGSPTFGECDAVELSAGVFNSVYLPEGLGHALMALEDGTVVSSELDRLDDAGPDDQRRRQGARRHAERRREPDLRPGRGPPRLSGPRRRRGPGPGHR